MSARPNTIPHAAKDRLKIMYIAKHAQSSGASDPVDGTHATYHVEIRDLLANMGLNLIVANSYRSLFEKPAVDFVFPLLNRGGFLNSEMLLPLLCNRLGLPYLGASPIIRGLSDDKHLTKTVARARGLRTADWAIYRRFNPVLPDVCPRSERYVIKPNASSASWGVRSAGDWDGVATAVAVIHAEGHDAIVEPFIVGHDIEVSVITLNGEPLILPTMIVEQRDPSVLRTYLEKRNLDESGQAYQIRECRDAQVLAQCAADSRALMPEFMPFDYGRYEFRLEPATGQIYFLEVNLNCNLWSQKTISIAAGLAGWTHAELIESILAESLGRCGLLGEAAPAGGAGTMIDFPALSGAGHG